MNYLRSRSLKRFLSIGRRSNPDESLAEECVDVVAPPPPNKPTWRCFSFEELDQATNGFHRDNVVGKGGYGEVYCGILEDGRAVAVKRLAPTAQADEKKEKDFLTELGTVGHVRHPNVSSLLGCCVRRPRPPPRLRVLHPRLRLRQPPRREAAVHDVEAAARGGRRHGAWVTVPPQGLRAADNPPGHQGVQHPQRRLRAPDFGLRPHPVAAGGVNYGNDTKSLLLHLLS